MPTDVSVKKVPDEIMEKLRKRAKLHHRSIQDELMAILEQATETTGLTFEQADTRIKALHLKTGNESTAWIREMRDAR